MKEFNKAEYRQKALVASVSDVDAKGIVDIAIASFNNVDAYGDIIRNGAFKKTFKDSFNRIKHVVDHGWTTKDIVGLPLKLWETQMYAMASSQLNINLESGKNLFEQYKFFAEHDRSLEHSIAYRIIKTNDNTEISGYDISELAMREYTTCGWGANAETPLIGLKNDNQGFPAQVLLKWLSNGIAPDNIEEAKSEIADTIELLLRKANVTDAYGRKLEDIIADLRKTSEKEPSNHSAPEPSELGAKEIESLLKFI